MRTSYQLGNYIHWRYENYLRYGLSMNNNGGGYTEKAISGAVLLQRMKKATYRNVPGISAAEVASLEQQLSYFYGTPHNNRTITAQERNNIVAALTQYIRQQVGGLANFTIDPNTLQVSFPRVQGQRNYAPLSRSFTSIDGILNRIQELIARYNILRQSSDRNHRNMATQIRDFLDNYRNSNFEQQLQDLSQNPTQLAFGQMPMVSLNDAPGQNYWNGIISSNFIDDLNDLIEHSYIVDARYVTGLVAEYMSVIMPNLCGQQISTNTRNLIRQFSTSISQGHVGEQRSVKVILPERVFGAREVEMGSYTQSFGRNAQHRTTARVSNTQDKVDVVLTLGQNRYRASVKNYPVTSRHIRILTGSSLLKYLQMYPALGTHYLNITANGADRPEPRAPLVDVQAAHQAMLVALGTHALAGGIYGGRRNESGELDIQRIGTAEVLIMHWRDVANQRASFRVYPIQQILHNIENYIDVEEFRHGPQIWNNRYIQSANSKDAYARCIQILSDLHRQHLTVSLNTSALDRIKARI